MKPTITEETTGTLYNWNQGTVKILVSRVETHQDGRITGGILIQSHASGMVAPHIHQSYPFNFTSDQSRTRLANKLAIKYAELCDWDSVLEQLCVYTCDRQSKGEPIEEILSSDTSIPPQWLLRPIIIEKYPTIIYGDRGTHKTGLALILSQMGAYGGQIAAELPEFEINETLLNTLYLDYESDKGTIQFLLSRIQRGMGLPQLSIHYRRRFAPLAHDIDQIKQDVKANRINHVVIDSLGLAAGGDLNSTDSALNFWAAYRQLDCAATILAHNQKNAEHKTVFGSVYFENLARNIWELKKQQEPNSPELNLALFHRKPAPFMNYHPPIGLKITFSGDGSTSALVVSPGQPQSVHEFVQQMGIQSQILALLKDGSKDLQFIKSELSVSESNARMALSRLTKKGSIIKLGQAWGLAIRENIEV